MINSLYALTRKGWLKALSFLLASGMFALILFKSALFAQAFGGRVPYFALLVFYGMAVLWIHGIGFEIKSALWQAVFLPIIGYLIVLTSFVHLIRL